MARFDPDHILVAMAYDGSRFHGVWPQPDVPTVARTLQARLASALGRSPDAFAVVARTDTGVHARLNLATLRLWPDASTDALAHALTDRDDGLLGLRLKRVPWWVHARGMASRKRYIYAWHEPLDKIAMSRAAELLVGTHDVSALRGRRVDPARCADVHMDRVEVREREGRIELVVQGDRFVRHQVRIMAALLAQVGRGAREPADIHRVLQSRDRRHGARPAPGEGLTLCALELRALPGRWLSDVDQVDFDAIIEAMRP